MPVDESVGDDEARETYNFAPGNHGLVYRADVPDWGAGGSQDRIPNDVDHGKTYKEAENSLENREATKYKLQIMKWGLVPFWTKRSPDYGSVMRTINARDDSLASKGGMWNTMKQKKRCIVVAQGFYEWLKKNGGKEKIPHYIKRKDEQLMCFAGLWDCVQYEGSDEKHYTYTIITTDSNKQLTFLHDRMPVVLENGSDQIRTWLDPGRSEWSKELQSLLKPYEGELECYPVSKDVGKVGNNSPSFIVPVASAANKNNIANFFGNSKKSAIGGVENEILKKEEEEVKNVGAGIEEESDEQRPTVDQSSTEDNAHLPYPAGSTAPKGTKREREVDDEGPEQKTVKSHDDEHARTGSPQKPTNKKTRSATSNQTARGSPIKSDGSQKITSFLK